MKVAKVIATCFLPKVHIPKSYLVGDPLGYFGHSQKSDTGSDIIDLLKFSIEQEKLYEPGVNRDLIIVNNNVNYEQGNKFIEDISETDIPFGKIKCITRENIGRSFGAYNEAFLKFRKDYDFFLFSEDDVIIAKDNYFKIGLEIWNNSPKAGFIAYISKTKIGKWHWEPLGLNKDTAYSCHGATGLSSTKILDKVVEKHGSLPYYHGAERGKDITFGEVAFPNSILQLGYKIIDLPKNMVLAIPAYDLKRGLNYKKWPSTKEKLLFLFKSNIYKLFSINKTSLKFYLRIVNKLKNKL